MPQGCGRTHSGGGRAASGDGKTHSGVGRTHSEKPALLVQPGAARGHLLGSVLLDRLSLDRVLLGSHEASACRPWEFAALKPAAPRPFSYDTCRVISSMALGPPPLQRKPACPTAFRLASRQLLLTVSRVSPTTLLGASERTPGGYGIVLGAARRALEAVGMFSAARRVVLSAMQSNCCPSYADFSVYFPGFSRGRWKVGRTAHSPGVRRSSRALQYWCGAIGW